MKTTAIHRRLSAGVEVQDDRTAHVRVWAPACRRVEFVRDDSRASTALERDDEGCFNGFVEDARPGDRHWFRLDGERLRPDPVSRHQPDGPHGPSAIVDPGALGWTDHGWTGVGPKGQVVYEMHVGTFTPQGTWVAAARELEQRAGLGVTSYQGSAQESVSCAKYGYLYQGQWYAWQKKRRGSASLDLLPSAFVCYMENHDQVANSGFGRRLHQISSPSRYRALTALTLLGPGTPMLFQGQEFASSAPFLYFADHREDLRDSIEDGRREFLAQFPSLTDPDVAGALRSPVSEETFRRCKLDLSERRTHPEAYALHTDLLHLRRSDGTLAGPVRVDGAVLAPDAFVLRFWGPSDDRLLVVNLGCDRELMPAPEPLLAAPAGARWEMLWSSETPRYGGQGTTPPQTAAEWRIAGESAIVLRPVARGDDDE